ncbi:MAG: DUF998 domain-containing protein [Flavobacteriales bacterium]|nr:DUF998 domain-containing protein [Flavobacteriales bacterium]
MSIRKARFWRRIYLIFSLALGVTSPFVCWYLIPEFNPIIKPLSYFGVSELTAWYWNASLIVISFALYLNAKKSIPNYFGASSGKQILDFLLIISFLGLIITAIFPMDKTLIHRISATCFFLSYNLFIFYFGVLRSKKYIRKGMFSMIIGCCMLLSSLLLLPFPSYGVFEIVYFLFALLWNGKLFYKRIRTETTINP